MGFRLWQTYVKNRVRAKYVRGYILERQDVTPTKSVDTAGGKLVVPRNSERVLMLLYGEDWQTPIRNFDKSTYGNRLGAAKPPKQ